MFCFYEILEPRCTIQSGQAWLLIYHRFVLHHQHTEFPKASSIQSQIYQEENAAAEVPYITSGADQVHSHHKRKQLLPSHTKADGYHPTPWGALLVYENHWRCVTSLADLKSLLGKIREIFSA